MRLFSRPNGKVDAVDRAQWLTPPFDRHAQAPAKAAPPVSTKWLPPRPARALRTGR